MTDGLPMLAALVREAEANVEAFTCGKHGHAWETDGGRACPRGGDCSQAAYRCRRCGEWDYGDPGGPGYCDCYGSKAHPHDRRCDGTLESDDD